MPSLTVIVLVLQVIIHLITALGPERINSISWGLYNWLPSQTSKLARDYRRLQREVLALRRQMNSTSSQDEFAKWAKLRRQHDKLTTELEKSSAALSSSKTTFDRITWSVLKIATTGSRWLLQFQYSKAPVFWIPRGWLPYYIEWLLSFPRAPLGSVSVQVWWIACANAVALLGEAVLAIYGVLVAEGTRKDRRAETVASRTKPSPKPEKVTNEKEL